MGGDGVCKEGKGKKEEVKEGGREVGVLDGC